MDSIVIEMLQESDKCIPHKFVNGKPVMNKLVDFQMYNYGSPATDLFFFLFTSILQLRVLQDHFDDLVHVLPQPFRGSLREFNHDGPSDFEKMKRGMALEAKKKVRFMVQVCGKKGWL
ncbi:hypothetical protein NQ318_009291 [Aromia moschata]|uniref:Uncharacterized protein n=1 Tax=Aromia moschata TaxID=1265417 RepID=A0AAV8YL78_9CUCU|nr:hypothetical protein NQ318_009291 [Aromia moschata]